MTDAELRALVRELQEAYTAYDAAEGELRESPSVDRSETLLRAIQRYHRAQDALLAADLSEDVATLQS